MANGRDPDTEGDRGRDRDRRPAVPHGPLASRDAARPRPSSPGVRRHHAVGRCRRRARDARRERRARGRLRGRGRPGHHHRTARDRRDPGRVGPGAAALGRRADRPPACDTGGALRIAGVGRSVPPRGGRRGRGARGGRRSPRPDVHDRIHRARAARDASRAGGVGRRPPHRVDRHAAAVRRAGGARGGAGRAGGAGARDRARHGRRLRRQAHRRGRDRGGPSVTRERPARERGLDASGGVHLGVRPSGRRDRRPLRCDERRRPHRVGVHQHQLRRRGDPVSVRDPQPADRVPPRRLPVAAGLLPRAGRDGEPLRPGVAPGRAGAPGRRRSVGAPSAASPRRPARGRVPGGGRAGGPRPDAARPRARDRHRGRRREGRAGRHVPSRSASMRTAGWRSSAS